LVGNGIQAIILDVVVTNHPIDLLVSELRQLPDEAGQQALGVSGGEGAFYVEEITPEETMTLPLVGPFPDEPELGDQTGRVVVYPSSRGTSREMGVSEVGEV